MAVQFAKNPHRQGVYLLKSKNGALDIVDVFYDKSDKSWHLSDYPNNKSTMPIEDGLRWAFIRSS